MYLVNEEYTKAIRTFNVILNYQEENAEAYFLRGYAKFQLSDNAGAVVDFTTAIELDKFLTDALYYRAIAYTELNNYRYALNDLIKAIDIDDRHTHYFSARGYLHIDFGDTLGAIKDFKHALKIEPENERVLLSMGSIYLQKKDYNESMNYVSKAIALNKNNKDAILLKGNILHYQEEYRKGFAEYQKVIELDSNNVRTLFFMALCLQELKSYDSANTYFDRTITLNADNPVAYYHRALLFVEMKRYSEALKDLNKVIRINPQNIYSYQLRGIVKIYLEDYAGAEKDFTHVIELYPLMVDAYQNRAYTRGVQNKIEEYYADKNAIDSLFNLSEGEFEGADLDYFKSITDFRADFTNTSSASSNKIQYIEQSIRMLSIYHFVIDKGTDRTKRIDMNDLIQFNEIDVQLSLINYDYSELSNEEVADLKQQIDKSIRLYPDSAKYEIMKALVLGWQMEYDYAIEVLQNQKLNYPESYIAEFIKANYHYFVGSVMASFDVKHFNLNEADEIVLRDDGNKDVIDRYENAVEHYNSAIKLNPGSSYAYYNRAYVNALLKNYAAAIDDYTHCINSEYEFPQALYNRGLLHIYLNRNSEGCSDLSKAGELGIDNAYRVIYKYCKE